MEPADNTDLLARLDAAQKCFIKLSEIALKQKNVEGSKKLDIYAVAIYEAIDIVKNTP